MAYNTDGSNSEFRPNLLAVNTQEYHLVCDSLSELDTALGHLKTLWRSCRYQELDSLDDEGHQESASDMSLGGHATTVEQIVFAVVRAQIQVRQLKRLLHPKLEVKE